MIVISDIHANLPALEAVLADAPDEPIYCCGDVIGYGPFPGGVIDVLTDHDVTAVRGNHDEAAIQGHTFGLGGDAGVALRWTLDQLNTAQQEFLSELPYTHRESVDGADVFMAHGSPRAPTEEYVYQEQVDADFLAEQGVEPDILLVGHTHVPFTKSVGETLVLNPGSVGQPRDGDPRASYAVLDPVEQTAAIRRVTYDIDTYRDRVADAGLPATIADRLYDGR